jgi:hypothetical protein
MRRLCLSAALAVTITVGFAARPVSASPGPPPLADQLRAILASCRTCELLLRLPVPGWSHGGTAVLGSVRRGRDAHFAGAQIQTKNGAAIDPSGNPLLDPLPGELPTSPGTVPLPTVSVSISAAAQGNGNAPPR